MRDSEKNTVKHRGRIVVSQKQKLIRENKEIIRDCLKSQISRSESAPRDSVKKALFPTSAEREPWGLSAAAVISETFLS